MVAQQVQSVSKMTPGPAAAPASSAVSDDAGAGDNSDFNSLLTQHLDPAAVAPANSKPPAKKTEEVSDSESTSAAGADAALLQSLNVLPVIVDSVQVLRPTAQNSAQTTAAANTVANTEAGAVGSTAAILAGNVGAMAANAQLQATATPTDLRLPDESELGTPVQTAQVQLLTTAALVATQGASAAASSAPVQASATAITASLTQSLARPLTQSAKDQSLQAQLTQALQMKSADQRTNDASLSSDTSDKQQTSKQDADLGVPLLLSNTVLQSESHTELQVQARVGTPAWSDEVAAKLTWMIDRGIQHGTLRLSPENLGPLEVRITSQNDQVSVWFGAAHADTRAALENALPRLREMFAAQGLSLSDAGVFREPPRDMPRGYASQRTATQSVSAVEERTVVVGRRDGILDAYA